MRSRLLSRHEPNETPSFFPILSSMCIMLISSSVPTTAPQCEQIIAVWRQFAFSIRISVISNDVFPHFGQLGDGMTSILGQMPRRPCRPAHEAKAATARSIRARQAACRHAPRQALGPLSTRFLRGRPMSVVSSYRFSFEDDSTRDAPMAQPRPASSSDSRRVESTVSGCGKGGGR